MRAQTMSGRVLVVLVAAYLGLAGLELVRILRVQRPGQYAVGVFPWEVTPPCYRLRSAAVAGGPLYVDADPGCEGTPRVFHWTGERARWLEPLAGPLLTLPIYAGRPDIEDGIAIEISVAGVLLDAVTLREGGWQELAYYLPPLLGEAEWSEVNTTLSDSAAQSSQSPTRAGWLELTSWTRDAVPPSLSMELAVGTTFVPAQHAATDDRRRLGIGVGQLRWETELPEGGIGFHGWETDDDGTPFRWTRRRASQTLRTRGDQLVVGFRADHPDIAAQPVEVSVFWEARLLGTVVLTDNSWSPRSFAVDVPVASDGVLSLHVDRVWTPAVAGRSDDARQLGVAISAPEWR